MTKTKVLVFVDWFIPAYKAGGPITSMSALADVSDLLEIDLYILTGDRDLGDATPFSNVILNVADKSNHSKVTVYYMAKGWRRWFRIPSIISAVNPDVLYVNGIFSFWFSIFPLVVRRLGMINQRIIICPRGMLGDNTLKIKHIKKTLFLFFTRFFKFYRNAEWHATSDEEEKNIRKHVHDCSAIHLVNNIPSVFKSAPVANQFKDSGKLKLIYYSRILEVKNLLFFLEVLTHIDEGEILFDIFGPIEDHAYWQSCLQIISKLPKNIHVSYKGTINPRIGDIPFSQYHFMVLPTLHENFGHVISEALASGCPVIISDHTPWSDVEQFDSGFSLPLSKTHWVTLLHDVTVMDNVNYKRIASNSILYCKKKVNYPQLLNAYRTMLKSHNQ